MDLRIEKTRTSIKNSFLQLRSKKPLEKITIKELAEMAKINKATFYLHYRDIYDLSETLERQVVCDCLKNVENPKDILGNVGKFIRDLEDSFNENEHLIKILFEGTRSSSFTALFEEELYKIIAAAYPDHVSTLESRMMTTFLIHGAYYTYFNYIDQGIKPVLKLLESLSGGIVNLEKQ